MKVLRLLKIKTSGKGNQSLGNAGKLQRNQVEVMGGDSTTGMNSLQNTLLELLCDIQT